MLRSIFLGGAAGLIGLVLSVSTMWPGAVPDVQEKPPALTVVQGQIETEASLSTYSWDYRDSLGFGIGVNACCVHPLEREDLPVIHAEAGDQLILSFPIEPDKLTVQAYSDQYLGNFEDAFFFSVELENSAVRLTKENMDAVYEVNAQWTSPSTWGGSVYYVFHVTD